MRIPDGGRFVDGNPDNGTIVRASFLNAVLGELTALLALGNIAPLSSGDQPEDHAQLAGLFASSWLRVGENPPTGGVTNAVWLKPSLLLAGDWPFFVFNGVNWVRPPDPLPEAEEEDEEEDPDPSPTFSFNDLVHGQRGGGALHAPATVHSPGFMTPNAVQLLHALNAVRPQVFRSPVTAVQANSSYDFLHNLPGIPDVVTVLFAPSGTPNRVVSHYRDNDGEIVGCQITVESTLISLSIKEHCWGGLVGTTYTRYQSGFYSVRAIYFGL